MMDRIRMMYDIRMEDNSEDAEIMIYGGITGEKWDDTDVTASDFDKAVKEAKGKGARRMTVRINSPGGSVFQAVAMRSILANAGMERVNVKIEGICASAATLISTLPGAHVSIAKGAEFMIHNPSTIAFGTANDLEKEAALLHKMEDDFVEMYSARCGNDKEKVKNWMDNETWFNAQETVDAGFADEVTEGAEIAACADKSMMDAMMRVYKHIPTDIVQTEDNNAKAEAAPAERVVNIQDTVTNIEEEEEMENEQQTMDVQEAVRMAVEAERQRIRDIRDMTPIGGDAMMQEAIDNGTDAVSYCKMVIASQRKKGEEFIEARVKETAPAKTVQGDEPVDARNESAEMDASAKEVASYAEQIRREISGGMY